jgi:predicted acyltransferase (DUF342 family)
VSGKSHESQLIVDAIAFFSDDVWKTRQKSAVGTTEAIRGPSLTRSVHEHAFPDT